ncbi:IclR family transcriptional regulator [Halomonas denitrificans]|uniref:IclR family transcriptional regulator n=1 Tax=Halomonas TaxID=2745 RepID=UPI001C981AC6|nr:MULTISPECIES: IclR family transcriptional regulator [Halomonas]MED5294624.1 IclR family transcriptional regulator [Pseudomonadota bacterium]MBY5925176.1 IclR family transcriptional regulator [Halomonas sp. DP4Y7-2]MBY5929002.1 IclR family transcriptional regulator [Halomonas sp. DP8Y7-3]MBY5968095.1 IclR family transcriptional regulator [Halomonas denitrificans]MBY5983588.1 IclR family transcriptional regulator [Halomonas sp. DP5Y7-2]
MTENKRRAAGRPATGKTSGGHSQSLVRGLNLLELLAMRPGGLALSDIAEQADLAPSTTHRLLQALLSQGFVTQDETLGVWRIDVKTFRIGNSFLEARDFVATSRPYLRRLTRDTGETANLGVRDGTTAVFLAQSESPQMMRMITRLGSRAPLHASGVGKALMAWLPDDDLERVLAERGLDRVTVNTLSSPSELRRAMAEIRQRGYACDREEHAIGLHCVAACIHDELGTPLAAISVSGPVARIPDERLDALGERVRDTAAEITAQLGGRVPEADEFKP